MDRLLPEIIDIILEFQGYHRLRNGKYMSQLYLEDKKYDELKTKPMIIKYKSTIYKTIFQKMDITYTITTSFYSEKVHWYMDKYLICQDEKINNGKSYYTGETYHYVYGHNDKQHLPVKNYNFLKSETFYKTIKYRIPLKYF
jgi:hypothetical protein